MAGDPKGARTDSGIEIKPFYTAEDVAPHSERPGVYPYTRGLRPSIRRDQPWTFRQYSGFGTAEATNERWRLLLANGPPRSSCASRPPPAMGDDSRPSRP